MKNKNLPNEENIDYTLVSQGVTQRDFCNIQFIERRKIKSREHGLARSRCGSALGDLLETLRKHLSTGKDHINEWTVKFLMENFSVLYDEEVGNVVVLKERADAKTRLKRQELSDLLTDADLNVEVRLPKKDVLDTRDATIKNSMQTYIDSIKPLVEKTSLPHIEAILRMLQENDVPKIPRSRLVGFLKISSYQFGGKK